MVEEVGYLFIVIEHSLLKVQYMEVIGMSSMSLHLERLWHQTVRFANSDSEIFLQCLNLGISSSANFMMGEFV